MRSVQNVDDCLHGTWRAGGGGESGLKFNLGAVTRAVLAPVVRGMEVGLVWVDSHATCCASRVVGRCFWEGESFVKRITEVTG